MSKKWNWSNFDHYMDIPLDQIREEFNINVIHEVSFFAYTDYFGLIILKVRYHLVFSSRKTTIWTGILYSV